MFKIYNFAHPKKCHLTQMDFRARTFGGERRYLLVDVKVSDMVVLDVADLKQIIMAMLLRFLGEFYVAKMDLEVTRQSRNRFIVSVQKEFATSVRASLALPVVVVHGKPALEELHVVQEASFVQPLIHSSRRFFQPLVE